MNHLRHNPALPPFGARRTDALRALLFLIASFVASTARATEPDAALSYRSPQLVQAEQEVARAEAELQRAYLGLGGSVEVTPYLEYSEDVRTPENAPTLGPGVEALASLGYTYDQPGILLETTELLQAHERLQNVGREGVRAALMAHADLLNAQLALNLERESLEIDKRDLEESEASFEAGEATETELEMARLGVDSGRRSLAYAQRTFRGAVAAAARYHLDGPVRFRPLEFALPEARPNATFAYRIAELELWRAEALALQDTVFGVVEDISLGTRYIGDDYEVSGGISLDQGRPAIGATARYSDRDPEAWTVTLEATLRLDDGTPDTVGAAQRDVEEARTYLNGLGVELAEELQGAREEAVFAGGSLDISVRDLALIERRIGELEVQTAALPGRLDEQRESLAGVQRQLDALRAQREGETDAGRQSVLDSAVTDFEGRVVGLETELQEAEQEGSYAQQELDQLREFRGQAEANLYRAWTDYLSAVDSYLALADAGWQAVVQ